MEVADLTSPKLELRNVRKAFQLRGNVLSRRRRTSGASHLVAVDDVTLVVRPGAALGLVGESGSGKTTVARSIVGLVKVDFGSILLDGEDVTNVGGDQLRRLRQRVQLIYQNPYSSLNPRLTVGSALSEAAHIAGNVPKVNLPAHVDMLLQQVGLDPALRDARPAALSGGQRQRVAIARALATGPEVLIADEATSALDLSIQAQILALFEDLRLQLGLTLIFISHQLAAVAHVCDRIGIMYQGRIVEEGDVEDVFARPAHPYTAELMAAHPDPFEPNFPRSRVAKTQLTGAVDRSGCVYLGRCPIALEVCRTAVPQRLELSTSRATWCHRGRELLAHPAAGDEALRDLSKAKSDGT